MLLREWALLTVAGQTLIRGEAVCKATSWETHSTWALFTRHITFPDLLTVTFTCYIACSLLAHCWETCFSLSNLDWLHSLTRAFMRRRVRARLDVPVLQLMMPGCLHWLTSAIGNFGWLTRWPPRCLWCTGTLDTGRFLHANRSFHEIIYSNKCINLYYTSISIQYFAWGQLPGGRGPCPPPVFRENQSIFKIYNRFLIILTLWPPLQF